MESSFQLEKINTSKMMRWKPGSHVQNRKEGVIKKNLKSKLEKAKINGVGDV